MLARRRELRLTSLCLFEGYTMVTTSIVRPAVWIGCLACYNEGELIGEWFDAEDAGEVTPDDVHDRTTTGHDEMRCFDIEGFPDSTGEMSPCEAGKWGEIFREIGKDEWGAYVAFVNSGISGAEPTEQESVDDFREYYRGAWGSFSNYLADEIEVLQTDWPEIAKRYFDWNAYERDAGFDYFISNAPEGNVYIFSTY